MFLVGNVAAGSGPDRICILIRENDKSASDNVKIRGARCLHNVKFLVRYVKMFG